MVEFGLGGLGVVADPQHLFGDLVEGCRWCESQNELAVGVLSPGWNSLASLRLVVRMVSKVGLPVEGGLNPGVFLLSRRGRSWEWGACGGWHAPATGVWVQFSLGGSTPALSVSLLTARRGGIE